MKLRHEDNFEVNLKQIFWFGPNIFMDGGRDRYLLRADVFQVLNPVGARFSAPVKMGPEVLPASCIIGNL
jgi:hypothetical protein